LKQEAAKFIPPSQPSVAFFRFGPNWSLTGHCGTIPAAAVLALDKARWFKLERQSRLRQKWNAPTRHFMVNHDKVLALFR